MTTSKDKDCEDEKTSLINQFLAVLICCSLSLMYGLTVGWSSAAVSMLEIGGKNLPSGEDGIDSLSAGWIGGAYCLGALVSSPVHGLLADFKGRKFAAYFVAFWFALHWILIAASNNMMYLYIGRFFGGIAGAGSITVISIYINEVADDKIRGTLGALLTVLFTSGILTGYIMGAFISFYNIAYINIAISVSFFLVWGRMPETPKYLLLRGFNEEALKAIIWLRKCSTEKAKLLLMELKLEQVGSCKTSTIKEFFQDNIAKRGLVITGILVILQNTCGIFAVNSYTSSIFKQSAEILDPFLATIIYGITMFISTLIPQFFVERLGRRFLLGLSFILLGIGMGTLATYYMAIRYNMFDQTNTNYLIIPIVTLCECTFGYFMGLGSVTYTVMVEFFSDETRGVAGSILASICWFFSFLLLLFFSTMTELLGDYVVFYFFTSISAIGIIFTYFYLPETSGLSFTEISKILQSKEKPLQ